jgi:pentatricopeptide repeat protein
MAFGTLADALTELGRYDDAVKALDQMVSLKPNLSSYSRISYMRELHGDTSGAETAMEMAIQAGAPNAENTAWCIVQLGNLYLGSGRVNEAESAYRAALARFPKYVHAYAGLAKAFVTKEQFGDAELQYKKAIEQVPMPEFLMGLGEIYERMGRLEDAQAQFGLVRAIQQIYRENGVQMDGEMALFNADHDFEPDQALVAAKREWQKRNSIKTADIYAWTLHRNGRHKEAENIMSQALRLGTRDPLLYYHAGMISYAMKKPDKAVNYLSTALRLNPGFSPVHAEHARHILKLLETEEGLANGSFEFWVLSHE